MLLAILVVVLVAVLCAVAIGMLSTALCARLGLHPHSVLRWLGVVAP